VITFLKPYRWWIAAAVFSGLACACAAKHGAVEAESSRVWEEADRLSREAAPRKEA
jgi:hypothetical protein